jgi:hypothetical protein
VKRLQLPNKVNQQSCRELFALVVCGTLPKTPWIGSVLGIKPRNDGSLLFISDSEKREFKFLGEVLGKEANPAPTEKKIIILRLLSICCYLRNVGLDLLVITPEIIAINLERRSIKLVSLTGAKFVGLDDDRTRVAGEVLQSVHRMISIIL